jgi:hypothetical protein
VPNRIGEDTGDRGAKFPIRDAQRGRAVDRRRLFLEQHGNAAGHLSAHLSSSHDCADRGRNCGAHD